MVKAVDRAREIGASAMQIFTDNPTAWKRRAEPPEELADFRRRLHEADVRPVSVHASYLVNLAGSNEESFERSIVMLAHELRQAPDFGARFVNVHIGSHLGRGVEAGIERLAEGITRTLEAVDAPSAGMRRRGGCDRRGCVVSVRHTCRVGRAGHARARKLGRERRRARDQHR